MSRAETKPPLHHRPWISVASLVIATIGVVFQITGPIPREWLEPLPGVITQWTLYLSRFMAVYGIYIAVVIFSFLAYWQRRLLLRSILLIYRYAYVELLAFLLRPVVERIISRRQFASRGTALVQGATMDEVISRPGWRFKDSWEILEQHLTSWEIQDDRVLGKEGGIILHRDKLPRNCVLEFDATLLENNGSDEIDVIFWDVMILFYREGIRQDIMTEDLQRKPGTPTAVIRPPEIGRTYHFKIERRQTEGYYSIDGKQLLAFGCYHGGTVTRERYGFWHWKNKVEFKNVRLIPA